MRFRYTSEHVDFLREHYPVMSQVDLTAAFNAHFKVCKTASEIKSALKNKRITCGDRKGRWKGKLKSWTIEQAAWVKSAYRDMRHDDMAEPFFAKFGIEKSTSQFRSLIHNNGWLSGRDARFSKGNVPFNKGTKGLMKANSGTFQRGNVPHNERPMGYERLSKDGYVEVKVPGINKHTGYDGHFVLKHKYIWEQEYGALPEGMAVTFIDGDRTNICIENLELIGRAELLQLNRHGIKDLPAELLPSMRAVARLQVAVHQKVREA